MEKESFKTKILKRKFSILTIIALLITVGVVFGQKEDYKYTLFYQYQAIPDIELKNNLFQTQGVLSGEVSGFVKFDNLSDQPRDVRQYYIIKPLNKFDENQSQYFSLEEIIKMNYISPRSLGISELIEVNETSRTITLEDESENQFFVDKTTKEVSMRDVSNDSTVLITSDSDYKDFMKEWLLKK